MGLVSFMFSLLAVFGASVFRGSGFVRGSSGSGAEKLG